MKITFNPAKRATTLRFRSLDFADASLVFAGALLEFEDSRQDYGEVRIQTIGYLAGRMVMVVWTCRAVKHGASSR
jgi:uncharacterized DUF497 family protein